MSCLEKQSYRRSPGLDLTPSERDRHGKLHRLVERWNDVIVALSQVRSNDS